MEGFRSRETRSSSEISGGSTVSADEKETSRMVTETTATEWTDEKHSLYLKSMEASFVNQLHNSMDLLGWNSQTDNPCVDTHSSSGQFKVLRSGCWKTVNFKIGDTQSNNAAEPRALLANPWFRHFRSSCGDQVVAPSTLQENASSTSQKLHSRESKELYYGLGIKSKHFPSWHSKLCHQNSIGSNEEESAQNFVDEDVKGGEAGSTCSAKRIKTLTADGSSNDQVVPFDKCIESRSRRSTLSISFYETDNEKL